MEMELQHNELVVSYEASKTSMEELLTACKNSGFVGSIASPQPRFSRSDKDAVGTLPSAYVHALARAKVQHKPVVLYFSAAWCAPCQKMQTETLSDARVKRLLQRCEFVKVDADDQLHLPYQYGVTGLPDIRFLSANGAEIRKLEDFQDAPTFAQALEELITQSR